MLAEKKSTESSICPESGLGFLELLTVLGIVALSLVAAIPFLQDYYRGPAA